MGSRTITVAAAMMLSAVAGARAEAPADVTIPPALIAEIRNWVTEPVVLITVKAQNERHADLDQQEIDGLDQQWRAETEAAGQPLIAKLMGSPLSAYLTRIKAQSLGLYTEIFVMDDKGLSVGQSSITSDYWQGDEEKWLATYATGPDAMVISDPETNPISKTPTVQVSLTIVDPVGKSSIGAITVEVDLDEMASRQ